jgi:hypothetical protein
MTDSELEDWISLFDTSIRHHYQRHPDGAPQVRIAYALSVADSLVGQPPEEDNCRLVRLMGIYANRLLGWGRDNT